MSTQSPENGSTIRTFVTDLLDAYRYLGVSPGRYINLIVVPTLLLSGALLVAVILIAPSPLVAGPAVLILLFFPVIVILYPKLNRDRQTREIREQYHLFLTHVTVLSTTNIDRVQVFREVAQRDEYGPIADEMGRIVALIDTLNQSLDDACRHRAQRVSSPLLEDFFDRLAYTISAGQPLDEFLVQEQETMIDKFQVRYESALEKIDVLKELYLSLILAMTFLLIFGAVVPILIDVSPVVFVGSSVVLYVGVQVGFIVVMNSVSPKDPVLIDADGEYAVWRRVGRPLIIGISLTVVLTLFVFVLAVGLTPLPPALIPRPLYLGIAITPLLWPGIIIRRLNSRVTDRDESFPAFIRALGGVEAVKQTSTASVLKDLRKKDFGRLTEQINRLYRRLRVRISTAGAWRLFGLETGSYLIKKFADMYVTGRRMGGDPDQLGSIIADNFNRVLEVRQQRTQQTTTLIGVIYGITAVATFAMFVGLGVVEQMLNVAETATGTDQGFTASLFKTDGYLLWLIELLFLIVILANAVLSAILIRVTDRGHILNIFVHVVALTWIGAVVGTVTQIGVQGLL
ncbi:MAG: archaeal flagella assembly protein J [halophilic archaeon J07HX64]|jgi:Archaeal flagella assembly protein J|nr:MAG: archaeal flagella assembly protein J [halophilic archaeon J07HX64]